MPWTRKQVRYLLSKVSPLSSDQKTKMVGELHADPALGHKKKGQPYRGEQHSYDFNRPKRQVVSRYSK